MTAPKVDCLRFAPGPGSRSDSAGRVGILFPFRWFDSVPCLVAGVEMLCEAGFDVDVLVPNGSQGISSTLPYFVESRGSPYVFVENRIERPGVARFIPYGTYESVAGPVARRRFRRALARSLSAESGLSTPYTCLIGVDPEGLVEAQAWSQSTGTPYLSWSLEILIRSELRSPHLVRLKDREVSANRGALFTIVQDEDRANLLASENNLQSDQIMLVPNAYRGSARRHRSFFAHELLDIPKSHTVVLSAGSIEPWTMTEQIVGSVREWPEGFTLVVHTRYDMRESEHAGRVIARADPTRVRFSSRPLSPDQYQELVDSADIGLALYQPQISERYVQGNLRTLGLSSGKLAAFLRAAIPVIVSRTKGAADLVEKYGCGLVVDDAEHIAGGLRSMRSHLDSFASSSARAFDEVLSVDRHFEPVVTAIKALPSKPAM